MRYRPSGFITSACLGGALLAGCAGAGSSATSPAAALPAAAAHQAVVVPHGGVRRTQSVPSCSGLGTGAFVGGGFENVADGAYSGVLEGNSNEVCDEESSVGGGYYNFISSGSNTSYYAWIGSGYDNSISGNGYQSVIGGGNVNALTAPNSVIGGGNQNTLSGSDSVIAGGSNNTLNSAATYGFIGGGQTNNLSSEYGVLVGGTNNVVSGEGAYIAAGGYNTASGEGAVVDGGFNSTASGTFATIPGGYVNSAVGTYSFAAGARATAEQTGTFVWSDGSDGDTILTSTAAYQFLARASGGFTLWTNAASTVGAKLAAGSGTWASASDRNLKTDVARIDDAAVLDKVAALPIERWSYKSERGVRHVGPMAQDFYAAFGVGEDDKHITSIDEDGVALAAIKALHARVGALDAENARLRRRLAAEAAHDRRVDAELAHIVAVLHK
jgi:uncharacterized protein YidB (DUF937 family)